MKKGWTIVEKKDGVTWHMVRGGAFSNIINKRYPKRIFDVREDAELYSNHLNREGGNKTTVKEVFKNGTKK